LELRPPATFSKTLIEKENQMTSFTSLLAFAAPAAVLLMASLPITSDFDSDTPGMPPATGGPDQPSNSSMFFQAENNLDGMNVFLGDGIRCAGGNLKRLKVKVNDLNGDADTIGTIITVRSAQLGYTIQSGDTLRYQWWYRDTNNPPCGLGVNDSNTSNGYEITWIP